MEIYLGIFPDFPVSSDESNECAYLPYLYMYTWCDDVDFDVERAGQGRAGQGMFGFCNRVQPNSRRETTAHWQENLLCPTQPDTTLKSTDKKNMMLRLFQVTLLPTIISSVS